MQEFEIKFLEVDVPSLEGKLLEIGAEKVGEDMSRIINFDFPGWPLHHDKNAWVRLRTEFNKTTMAYKQRLGVKSEDASVRDEGMQEIEFDVSDFNTAHKFLLSIGMVEKVVQERKRIRWKKNSVVFDIDCWPLIPPYLEIEGNSMEAVRSASDLLGFSFNDHLVCSANNVFAKYGLNIYDYPVLTFKKFPKI